MQYSTPAAQNLPADFKLSADSTLLELAAMLRRADSSHPKASTYHRVGNALETELTHGFPFLAFYKKHYNTVGDILADSDNATIALKAMPGIKISGAQSVIAFLGEQGLQPTTALGV